MCLSLLFSRTIETIMLLQIFPACAALSLKDPVSGIAPSYGKGYSSMKKGERENRLGWRNKVEKITEREREIEHKEYDSLGRNDIDDP